LFRVECDIGDYAKAIVAIDAILINVSADIDALICKGFTLCAIVRSMGGGKYAYV